MTVYKHSLLPNNNQASSFVGPAGISGSLSFTSSLFPISAGTTNNLPRTRSGLRVTVLPSSTAFITISPSLSLDLSSLLFTPPPQRIFVSDAALFQSPCITFPTIGSGFRSAHSGRQSRPSTTQIHSRLSASVRHPTSASLCFVPHVLRTPP